MSHSRIGVIVLVLAFAISVASTAEAFCPFVNVFDDEHSIDLETAVEQGIDLETAVEQGIDLETAVEQGIDLETAVERYGNPAQRNVQSSIIGDEIPTNGVEPYYDRSRAQKSEESNALRSVILSQSSIQGGHVCAI